MQLSSITKKLLFIISLILCILFHSTFTLAASTHPFYWEKMDVDLQLLASGDLLVTETQKYVFTEKYNNQRLRYIEVDKIDEIRDIVITEDNRPVSNLQISKVDGRQYIRWEHILSNKFPESHVFVVKYRVIGSLEVDDLKTKFKWMAIFPNRLASIKSAQITLHLPNELVDFAKEFTTIGAVAESKSIDSNTIIFTAKETINPQSQLVILGNFDTDSLKLKKSQWQPTADSGWGIWPWLIGLLILVSLFNSGSSSVRGGGDGGDGGGGCGGCGGCGGGD
jgi:Predicted membrane protein (DUF2207)